MPRMVTITLVICCVWITAGAAYLLASGGYVALAVCAGLLGLIGIGDWYLLRREWPDARPLVDRFLYVVCIVLGFIAIVARHLP